MQNKVWRGAVKGGVAMIVLALAALGCDGPATLVDEDDASAVSDTRGEGADIDATDVEITDLGAGVDDAEVDADASQPYPIVDHCVLDRDRNGDGRFNVRYTRGYDARGLMREQTRDDNLSGAINWRASFDYDEAERLIDAFYIEIDQHSDRRFLYTYDDEASGRLLSLTRLDNGRSVLVLRYHYDDQGRLSRIDHDGAFESVTQVRYEDDGQTVIEELDDFVDGEVDARDTYRYDAQGLLLSEEHEVFDGSAHVQSSYSYDAQGRLLMLRIEDLLDVEVLSEWQMVYGVANGKVQSIKFFGKSLVTTRPATGLLSLLLHAEGYPRLVEIDWFLDGTVNERIRYTGGTVCKLDDQELRDMVRNARWVERD